MKKIALNYFIIISLSIISPSLVFSASETGMQKKAIKIGIFPRRNPSTTYKFFIPLANYLSERLNRKMELLTAGDFQDFWQRVQDNEFDIVHYNQLHYIESHKDYEAIVKNEEFGKDTIAGAIFVRKDSGITSIRQLEGRTINFGGGPKAMMAYVVPTALLRRAGLREGDYDELFSKNPPNTVLSVYYRQAAAAATGDIILKVPLVTRNIDTSKLVSIAESEQLPHVLWAIKKSLPEELKKSVKKHLLELNNTPEGKKILEHAKLTGLKSTNDAEYDVHRKYIKEVFGE